jgi:mersacidin/lichenicidin family type 2 lantibiotic
MTTQRKIHEHNTYMNQKEMNMSNAEIVRAWKDPEYRATLNQIPPLPIGLIELEDLYLSESTAFSKGFAGRRGEHVTVTGCGNCTSQCHTVSHCPHTGWQCKTLEVSLAIAVQ